MNDATRRRWNILDKALCSSNGMVHTRADRCCYVYSTQSCERTWEPSRQSTIAQWHGTNNVPTESCERSEMDAAFEQMLDPFAGSPSAGKSVAMIMNFFVNDVFGKVGNDVEQRVLTRLGKDFQVNSEEKRIHWTKNSKTGPYIEVTQENAIEELEDQWNETRKKNSIALLPCIQITEAFWDRYICHRLEHGFSVAASSPDVLHGSFSNNWRHEGSQLAHETA